MLVALRPSESASIPASVFVIGADDHGRVVAELVQACRYSRINFVDDCFPLTVGTISNLPDLVLRYSTVTVSLGNLPFRQELLDRLESLSLPIPALAHFSATVSPSSQIGPGSLMLPGAVVQTNAVVCKGAFFSAGAVIDHDAGFGSCAYVDAGAIVAAHAAVPALAKNPLTTVFLRPSSRKARSHELPLCCGSSRR